MSEASGSRPKPNKKNGKAHKKPNGAKMKRLTEKQQIQALEKRALTFVSMAPNEMLSEMLSVYRSPQVAFLNLQTSRYRTLQNGG
jgi:hypothetical protein